MRIQDFGQKLMFIFAPKFHFSRAKVGLSSLPKVQILGTRFPTPNQKHSLWRLSHTNAKCIFANSHLLSFSIGCELAPVWLSSFCRIGQKSRKMRFTLVSKMRFTLVSKMRFTLVSKMRFTLVRQCGCDWPLVHTEHASATIRLHDVHSATHGNNCC